MTNPFLKLKIGTPVAAVDGPVGHVHQVILNPTQRRIIGLVVRVGLLPPRDLIVPVDLIDNATDEQIKLRVSRDDVLRQPAFDPAHYLPLTAEAESNHTLGSGLVSIFGGAPERDLVAAHQREETKAIQAGMLAGSTVALQRGQPVWALDERVGQVDLLLLDTAGQVRHFVVRKGWLLGYDVLVPVGWVKTIDERGVWLAVARTALDRLPEYRPDSAIEADVIEVLWQDEVIRTADIEMIDVTVRDGVVILSGYTVTLFNKARAERDVRQAPGVRDVENRLVPDSEVETAVAQALARDPRTRGQRISVYVKHGVVTLSGKINSAAVRTAAEEVAASVPQTRGIINDIQAPGVVGDPGLQRVLQPRIGQSVYAKDVVIGQVEGVIINPRHRRVTAVVVCGHFPDAQHAEAATVSDTVSDDLAQEGRWVVVSVEIIRDVTIGGIMLAISGAEVAQYPAFDPNDFGAPPPDWQPPYPYTHADVLLDATGRAEKMVRE